MSFCRRFLVILCQVSTVVVVANAECIIIKGGTVVNHDHRQEADVLIEGEKISDVGSNLEVPDSCTVIDAAGSYVMPGGIDPHTHLAMPFMGTTAVDDFFSGQRAALAGGTTMHIDFVLPEEGDIEKGLAAYRTKASLGCMDFGFHVAVTSWGEKVAKDMEKAARQGINSFKFFLAYKGALMVTDEQFLKGLQQCKELGALAMVHAENGDAVALGQQRIFDSGITAPFGHALSRPALLEGEATARAIRLARFINTPLYVVHVMSIDALEEVARAQQSGQRVIGEPVVSGLALDDSMLWHSNYTVAAQYVMSPPIRSAEHAPRLKAALAGRSLHLVATDHAVFNSAQKAMGRTDFRKIPNGVNGIEERLHVVWQEMVVTGMISVEDFVRITSTAAAQIFNVFPRKGAVMRGSDADVIVLDPSVSHTISAATHHSKMDTNVYEGKHIKGKVVTTISRGRLAWHKGEFLLSPGSARFVATPTGGRLFDGIDANEPIKAKRTQQKVSIDTADIRSGRFDMRMEL